MAELSVVLPRGRPFRPYAVLNVREDHPTPSLASPQPTGGVMTPPLFDLHHFDSTMLLPRCI